MSLDLKPDENVHVFCIYVDAFQAAAQEQYPDDRVKAHMADFQRTNAVLLSLKPHFESVAKADAHFEIAKYANDVSNNFYIKSSYDLDTVANMVTRIIEDNTENDDNDVFTLLKSTVENPQKEFEEILLIDNEMRDRLNVLLQQYPDLQSFRPN